MLNFEIKTKDQFQIIEFKITSPDGNITPIDLKSINIPEINYTKGCIISGRGPIWLFSFLAHQLHPSLWIASHDPRLGGAVVFASHTQSVSVGEIIKLD